MKTILLPRTLASLLLGALSLGLIATPASAALNVYAEMMSNGESIDGDTSVGMFGGVDVSQDHLEIHAVNHEAFLPPGSIGPGTSRLSHAPFKFVKPVDKASPLMQRAMGQNHTVSAKFKFFRNNPDSGIVEHYYTIELEAARVSGIRTWLPNNLDPAAATFPFMEEVSIAYNTILFRHEIAQTEWLLQVNSAP
jgi:type VI secretion system secreted protein Hcp